MFLQCFEDKYIKHLLDTKNVIFSIRYIDDILIWFDFLKIHSDLMIANMNQIHKDIKFNPAHEDSGQIYFLALLLVWKPSKIETGIFQKPTNTDTTISFFSIQPTEHEIAAYRYYITRMHSLPLTLERKQKEWTTVHYIAQTNNFSHTLFQKLNSQLQHRRSGYDRNSNTNRNIKTLTTFTYYSSLIRAITNLFKHTNVRIAFMSTNTIHDLTKPKMNINILELKKCGIYKLTCNTCKLSCIGHMSCNLKQRYQEHIKHKKQNDPQSAYALHILNNNHQYGPINTNHVPSKTNHRNPTVNSLWTVLHPFTLLPQGSHMGTKHRWTQPHVPVDLWPSITSPSTIYRINTPILDQLPRPQYRILFHQQNCLYHWYLQ